jgi:hypothetical protein
MSDSSNRRREPRRKLMRFTPVYDLQPRTLLGYVGDLTLKGMLVNGTTSIPMDKKTILEIVFPGDLPDIAEPKMRIAARIAWCRQDESPDFYNIGVEFTDVTPEQVQLIQQILERYHFRHALEDADIGPSM